MKHVRTVATVGIVLALLCGNAAVAQPDKPKPKKPSVELKATPAMAFAPARISLTADVKGGANDHEEFYCPTVSWEWGDGTESENTSDCDPYEPGKSEIRRHFTVQRLYDSAGEYRVVFRLKKAGKVVGAATTTVRIRPGLRDIG